MDHTDRLKYRRQYIIAPKITECLFIHNSCKLNSNFTLYTHGDLLVTEYTKDNTRIILLGDIFDYRDINKKNIDILSDIIDDDLYKFLENTSGYTGRFVLIYIVNNNIYIAHDATATRKIYYCKINDEVWCASQPHLLARTLGLKKTSNHSRLSYYSSLQCRNLNNSDIGDTTRYVEIKQVMPNHYLYVNEFKVVRYWPIKKLESLSLTDVVQICSKMIKGYMESIGTRYDIMLPVTAGKDTRTLLAATYNIRNEVFYYINKERRLNDHSNDIKIPKQLFEKLNLDFHILNPYIPVDKDFERIYYENNEYASEAYLPIIYNYHKNFSDKVNLPGNIATGGVWYYPIYRKNVLPETLTGINNVSQFEFAHDTYANWLKSCQELGFLDTFFILNLFYWEERLGNWGSQVQIDRDIAQEEFNPFNSRQLVEYILSVKPVYTLEKADYLLNSEIIKKLWPETLKMQINPGFTNTMLKICKFFGILGLVFKIKYR